MKKTKKTTNFVTQILMMTTATGAALVALPAATTAFQLGGAQAQPPATPVPPSASQPFLSTEAAQAVKTLQDAEYFAIGTVGYAGQTPPGETALRVLLKERNALPLFRGLLLSAKPAGQMYALVGIRQISAPAYAGAVARYQTRENAVLTMQGCLTRSETMSALTARMDKGEFVLWTGVTTTAPTTTKK